MQPFLLRHQFCRIAVLLAVVFVILHFVIVLSVHRPAKYLVQPGTQKAGQYKGSAPGLCRANIPPRAIGKHSNCAFCLLLCAFVCNVETESDEEALALQRMRCLGIEPHIEPHNPTPHLQAVELVKYPVMNCQKCRKAREHLPR